MRVAIPLTAVVCDEIRGLALGKVDGTGAVGISPVGLYADDRTAGAQGWNTLG